METHARSRCFSLELNNCEDKVVQGQQKLSPKHLSMTTVRRKIASCQRVVLGKKKKHTTKTHTRRCRLLDWRGPPESPLLSATPPPTHTHLGGVCVLKAGKVPFEASERGWSFLTTTDTTNKCEDACFYRKNNSALSAVSCWLRPSNSRKL